MNWEECQKAGVQYNKCADQELLDSSPFTCFICNWAPVFFFVAFCGLILLAIFG